MKKILISGSIANDYIMNFNDKFGTYILPEKTHQLSVNFNISELHAHAWWAGQNICYNLGLLWQESILLWAVWKERKANEFSEKWIDYSYTVVSETLHTATANIMTDEDNNQITAFYPGAILESIKQWVPEGEYSYMMVSPNLPDTMYTHVKEASEKNIPVFFDPGQPLSAFSKEQLLDILKYATYLIVNEYELDLLLSMTELEEAELSEMLDAYIVTLWGNWSRFVSAQESFEVPAIPVEEVKDPTGAGDAFRAWLLYALHNDLWWKSGMELWTKIAHACIQCHGTQVHTFDQ